MNQQDERPIRVWPAMVIVLLMWVVTFGAGKVSPGTPLQFFGMLGGPLVGLLLIWIWWFVASREPRRIRLGMVGLMILAYVVSFFLSHPSMALVMIVWAVPMLCLAFVIGVAVSRSWPSGRRRLAMAIALLLSAGVWPLLRAEGVLGGMEVDFAWRWAKTAEDRFLASVKPTTPGAPSATDDTLDEPQWPGFRGALRDGVIPGVRLQTDWTSSPPQALWRHPIGPGWSSFAVAGGRLFTQEQRGEEEIVACYSAETGEVIWLHRDQARFWEALAGAGPRATPTLHGGRVYTFGATGILNALDASDGSVIWSRNAATETGATIPDWGFASSPLIVDDLVIVHTGAPNDKAVAAYDLETGDPRWHADAGPLSYSSAHLTEIDGVRQIILLTGDGAASFDPTTGRQLWDHSWPMSGGARIVQPVVTADGSVLIGTGFGMGLRRIALSRRGDGWNVEERWTSKGLKPYFNDIVVHQGHAYGFDGRILSSVDLATGERNWKGGRYGHGQLILLPDQDLLLVLSEKGEVALVAAKPDAFTEISRIAAISGKTWNHPVLVDGILYVRNGEEMAAYRMPLASEQAAALTRRPR